MKSEVLVDVQRFEGGRQLMTGAGALGLLGLVATLAGTAGADARPAYFSYLFAFAYWGGIALASVVLLHRALTTERQNPHRKFVIEAPEWRGKRLLRW